MSTTIDQKVVEMRFDNGQFENNVQQSISSINRLKNNLQMDGATRGFEDINRAAQNVRLDSILSAVESLQYRFSTLGIVGMRVIENLTDSMMRLASRTLSFLRNGIVSGGLSRAMKLENAHFQLQGLLKDEKEVAAVMQNVGDAVDGTAYGLDAAAAVASQLAASGMKAGDEMFRALRGVAGVAAMTNSSYEDIGRIYTQVAGQGRLMGDQLLQLSGRGMNAAATLGKYLNKSEKQVREMVSDGQINFATFAAAMDDAFGEHAKKANETLNGAFSNVKSALGRIGAKFISPLIEQNGPLVLFLNAVREKVNEINANVDTLANTFTNTVSKMAKASTEFVKNFDLTDKVTIFYNLVDSIKNIGKFMLESITPIKDAFVDIFPPIVSEQIVKISENIKNFTSKLTISGETADKIKRTFKGVFSVFDIFRKTIISIAKPLSNLFGGLKGLAGILLTITSSIGDFLTSLNSNLSFDSLSSGFSEIFSNMSSTISNVAKDANSFGDIFSNLGKIIGGTLESIGSAIGNVIGWISKNFSLNDIITGLAGGGVYVAAKEFIKLMTMLRGGVAKFLNPKNTNAATTTLNALKKSLMSFSEGIRVSSLVSIAIAVTMLSSSVKTLSSLKIQDISKSIVAISIMLGILTKSFSSITKTLKDYPSKGLIKAGLSMILIASAIKILSSAIVKMSNLSLGQIGKGLTAIGIGLVELIRSLKALDGVKIKISTCLAMIVLANVCKTLAKALSKFGSMKWGEIIKGLIGMEGALIELSATMKVLSKISGLKSVGNGFALLIITLSLSKIAKAMSEIGKLSWGSITKGLIGMGVALGEISFIIGRLSKMAGFSSIFAAIGISTVIKSLTDLASSFSIFGGMNWPEIGKGLVGMGAALLEVAGISGALGKLAGFSSIFGSASIIIAIQGLAKLASAFKQFGDMYWGNIAKGLVGMGAALLEVAGISGALGKLAGFSSIFGATAIWIAIQGLIDLSTSFSIFGSMTWGEIGRGLVAMGGALLEVGGISAGLGALTGLAGVLGGASLWASVQGLEKLANGLKIFGSMSWDEIKRGLASMGGALGEIALGGLANTFSIIGSWSINNIAEGLGMLADSVKKWTGVTVPDNLGQNLALLGAGVSYFTFSGAGAKALSKSAEAVGILADSVVKWKDVTVPEDLGDNMASVAGGVQKFTLAGVGAKAIGNCASGIGLMADGIKKWSDITIPENFGTDLSGIADGISAFSFSFVGGWSMDSVVSGLTNLADVIVKWSNVSIPDNFKDDLTNLAEGVKSFGSSFIGNWSMDSLVGPLGEMATSISKWKDISIPSDIGDQLSKLAEGVKKFSWAFVGSWTIDSIGKPLGTLADSVQKWKDVKISSGIGDELGYLADGIKKFNGISDIYVAASGTETIANSVIKFKDLNFEQMNSGLSGFVSNLKDLSSIGTSLKTVGDNIVDGVLNPIKQNSESFRQMGSDIVTFIKDGINSNSSSLTSTLNEIIKNCTSIGDLKVNSFSSVGVKLSSALSKGITTESSKTKDSISKMLSDLTLTIKSKYTDFYSAGSYLVTGFVNGIDMNIYKASARAKAMAEAAVTSAEEELKIGSPSKVFTKIGEYTGMGFVNGLNFYVSKVKDTAINLGDTAKEGINNAINRISNIINYDLDSEPVIRPVLDLSNVQDGSNRINSMLGKSRMITTTNSINGIINRQNQNGVNDDLISAINKLGKTLSGYNSGDTYHIDGITYDDGTNVSNAVKSLIRAAKIERRV